MAKIVLCRSLPVSRLDSPENRAPKLLESGGAQKSGPGLPPSLAPQPIRQRFAIRR